MSRTQEWQIKTLFHNNFSKLGITNLLNKFFLSTANDAICESAETPNLSGNDFRQARKCQTLRETTFAKRGNAKPFGKRLSPSAEMPNRSGNDFRRARKSSFWPFCSLQKHEKLLFGLSVVCRSVKIFFLVFLQCAEA